MLMGAAGKDPAGNVVLERPNGLDLGYVALSLDRQCRSPAIASESYARCPIANTDHRPLRLTPETRW
jgi:hypothetical protein